MGENMTQEQVRKLEMAKRLIDEALGKTPDGRERLQNFTGGRITSRYGGACAVCGKPMAQGEDVLYNGQLRRAAHVSCGTEDDRRSVPSTGAGEDDFRF